MVTYIFIEIAIIGGFQRLGQSVCNSSSCEVHDYYGEMVNAVEVLSIQMSSVHHINRTIPLLPKGLGFLQGEKLPNGNFLLCGGLTGGLIRGGSRFFLQ